MTLTKRIEQMMSRGETFEAQKALDTEGAELPKDEQRRLHFLIKAKRDSPQVATLRKT